MWNDGKNLLYSQLLITYYIVITIVELKVADPMAMNNK